MTKTPLFTRGGRGWHLSSIQLRLGALRKHTKSGSAVSAAQGAHRVDMLRRRTRSPKISALLGLAAALGLGAADFMSHFSSRALGATLTYGVVLLVETVGRTMWLLVSGAELVWSSFGCTIAVAHGVSVSIMCILLYMGMARGPIAVVAPSTIVAGGILIARSAVAEPEPSKAGSNRTTVLIAFRACLAYVVLILTGQAATPCLENSKPCGSDVGPALSSLRSC